MLQHLAAGTGTVSAAVLLLFGLYATVYSRGAGIRHFPAAVREIFRKNSGHRSSFRAFATSLAGTVGVGNITGVSVAIACGGAGAVFWMWISALLCMTVKEFEIYLAVKHQTPDAPYPTVPMAYIESATQSRGFGTVFALAAGFSALLMGNVLQTKSAARAGEFAFGFPGWILAALFAAGVGILLSGGAKRAGAALEKILPVLCGVYLLLTITGILLHAQALPAAFREIFRGAFSPSAAAGGFAGSVIALRHGVSNGIFSHEAGLGSAGLAHGLAGNDPKRQSLWGNFEVAADTLIISTVSALFILTSGIFPTDGNGVCGAAEAVFGRFGPMAVGICLTLFAFLSVVSWGTYGETCFCRICGPASAPVWRILFSLAPLCALIADEPTLWALAEIANGLMLFFHVPGLVGHRKELKNLR